MASGTSQTVISGLGERSTGLSFPYTATSDGVIYFCFTATSSGSNSYLYLKEANVFNKNIFQTVSVAGAAIINSFVVKKGWKITVDYSSNATFSWLEFVPFV